MAAKTDMKKIVASLPKLTQASIFEKYQAQDGFNFYKALTYDATPDLYEYIERRANEDKANTILQLYGLGGTGKSYSMITLASRMDMMFKNKMSLDRIFFQLPEVSMYQAKIKRRETICVDERMPNYGLGATRLMKEFNSIIETAREPQNSIIVSSITPYLYDLAHWFLETMFIYDQHVYFALRNPKQIVFGYVKIPHPELTVGKKFLDDYMIKKRTYNDQLRHTQSYDHIADMAKQIMNSKDFKNAEEVFHDKKRGISTQVLIETISDKFPELRRNVECKQIAARIRANRIKSGAWKP